MQRRPLVLVGPSPSTTSQVARSVAEQLGARRVELLPAAPTPDGIGGDERARSELETLLARGQAEVVAAPAACLVRRPFRLGVLDRAVVVALDPGPPADAAETDGVPRELYAGVYAEAHARIPLGVCDEAAAAAQASAAWLRDGIAVAAGPRSYVVEVGAGALRDRVPELIGASPVACLVTDATVAELHGGLVTEPLERLGRPWARHVMTPGETSKILRSVEAIWAVMATSGVDRGSVVLALGGGVVTDTAGFAAATWMRGVRWVALPTTLLAMVDASVGGKTGVDLELAKNGIGAFWQPSAVVCDTDTLRTETPRAFASALAEVVKTALIGDPSLLDRLEAEAALVTARDPALLTEIVRRCIRVKARIVSLDEREGGLRAVLNLGHTVGHALETLGGYRELTHGEAVSLGLVAALELGQRRGLTPPALTRRVVALLERLSLPTALAGLDLAGAARLLQRDKKRAGDAVRFVFARAPGEVTVERVALTELAALVSGLAHP